MSKFVAAGLSFLLAVLWFDLMFDVQTLGHNGEILPPEVLSSISTYYRRVTLFAWVRLRGLARAQQDLRRAARCGGRA
jgi:hypothetical protein